MAGWRSLGYVADSDTEDDSQGSNPTSDTIKDAQLDEDIIGEGYNDPETEKRRLGQLSKSEKRAATSQSKLLGVLVPGQGSAYSSHLKVANAIHDGKDVHNSRARLPPEREQVDELQQDHYTSSPTVQLQAELLARAAIGPNLAAQGQNPIAGPKLSQHDETPQHDETHGCGPLYEATSHTSSASSPLSEISSLPNLSQTLNLWRHADITCMRAEDGTIESASALEASVSNRNTSPAHTRPSRNFRRRNPIQLRPYAIENENHCQTFHARGLKAMRYAYGESQPHAGNQTQSQDFDLSGSPSSRSSSPHARRNFSSSPSPSPQDCLPLNGDFPDMGVLLSHQSRQLAQRGWKRRKMNRPIFKAPPNLQSGRGPLAVEQTTMKVYDDVFEVPPSPPLSGRPTPTALPRSTAPKFRVPPQLSPIALPTPLASSEPRRHLQPNTHEGRPLDNQVQGSSQPCDDSDSASAPLENEASHHLERVQRKIRGVLPASWLKLDLRAQIKKPVEDRRNITNASPDKRSAQRGVARPVAKLENRNSSRQSWQQDLSDISDDCNMLNVGDETQTETPGHLSTIISDDEYDDRLIFESRIGEATEDDRIDAMLPAGNRMSSSRKKKKRQTRMPDFGIQSTKNVVSRQRKPLLQKSKRSQLQPLPQQIKNAKPKLRPPKLSILDASPLSADAPKFLKIAFRTTRARRDKGMHGPSLKVFEFAAREDTFEADQTLRDWKQGTIQPRFRHDSPLKTPRQPLLPRSANAGSPQRAPKSIVPLRPMQWATYLRRPRARKLYPVLAPSIQSCLDTMAHCSSNEQQIPTLQAESSTVSDSTTDDQKNRRRLVSSMRLTHGLRPAMLETLQVQDDQIHPRRAFSRSLADVNSHGIEYDTYKSPWDRSLPTTRLHQSKMKNEEDQSLSPNKPSGGRQTVPGTVKPGRRPKRRPQYVDTSLQRPRQSPSVKIDESPAASPQNQHARAPNNVDILTGLGPFGSNYTYTFDIIPFAPGTCFHQHTFLGSGDFERSMKLYKTNLDTFRGFALFSDQRQKFRWGPWTDAVSSELSSLLEDLSQVDRGPMKPSALIFMQRYLINYLSDHLSFHDPVDRISFVQKWTAFISTMSVERFDWRMEDKADLCRIDMYSLVLTNQICQISEHTSIPASTRSELRALLLSWVKRSAASTGSADDALTRSSKNNSIVIQESYAGEAIVVTRYILERDKDPTNYLWDVLTVNNLRKDSQTDLSIHLFERHWARLYCILPYLEFDVQGVLEIGRRFKIGSEDWACVKRLIKPVLDIYMASPGGQSPSFNVYCRALFARCLYLINAWGWRKCDTIIGTLFDFFARNNLHHLRNEESHGSPKFLESLGENPSLTPQPEDRCFHLLLKMIGSGIKHMRQLHPQKKTRDLVWRLMPNHGRSHPKEEAIRQEDLDALRNHHDLLCTLYWAAPPGLRPRIDVIRNLVQLESSHREACHINIRAWSKLINFQLSTDEPLHNLQPFVEWYDDLLQQILRQHGLARTEAEEQMRSIQQAQGLIVSQQLLESTIARNQRQVESILTDALGCFQTAVGAARTKEAVDLLLRSRSMAVLGLFDASRIQGNATIMQALEVVLAYTNKCASLTLPSVSHANNDDSQDYGDWQAFADDNPENVSFHPTSSPLQQIHDSLRQLLSNCFGADTSPNDHLLQKTVDVWARIGQALVNEGVKSWTDYIGRFHNDSWNSLRDTEQTRKYTAYYLAILIDLDDSIHRDHNVFFLQRWMELHVERESNLKFQHTLTNALLNSSWDEDLLSNLPFWRSRSTGRFEMTAAEYSERRLSLISSVFSNMRMSVERAALRSGIDAAQRRQEYKDLLKHLMTTMKRNYQELGHGSDVKGTYVGFVHRIVEFLQQHTSSICPVDRFFTDNIAFPLPATDPKYVVAQLKNYAVRLHEPRAPKELTVFLQSVSERAAVDGQQIYLVNQLHTAMSGCIEDGASSLTLRVFIVRAIAPAYIEMATKTPCGWILVMPFLLALRMVFDELFLSLNSFNTVSVESVTRIILTFLASVQSPIAMVLDQPDLLSRAAILATLSACYDVISALLPALDYLVRLGENAAQATQAIDTLADLATGYLASRLGDETMPLTSPFNVMPTFQDQSYSDIRNFARSELKQTLDEKWLCEGDQYFVVRGTSKREVVVDVGLFEEERDALKKSLETFVATMNSMPALSRTSDDEYTSLKAVHGFKGLVF